MQFKDKYLDYVEKFVTVYNGYDENDVAQYRGVTPMRTFMQLVSIGSMYYGRSPKKFLEVLEELLAEGNIKRNAIKVLFIGAQNAYLNAIDENHFLYGVVKTLPQMPQEKTFRYVAESHVALLVGSDMEKTAMTSKVYEYAGMGKLIFALVPDGPVKDFVIKCNGIVADPKEKVQIKSALKELVGRWQKGEIADINVAAITAASQYERSVLTFQMAGLFDKCFLRFKR